MASRTLPFLSKFHTIDSPPMRLQIQRKVRLQTVICIFFTIYYLLFTIGLAQAFTMENANYRIRMGNFNTAPGKSTAANNKPGITVGKTAIPFSFSISQPQIDFGVLSATNPVTRTNSLTISNGSAGGYTVIAYANHQLLLPVVGSLIPDTTCDDGTCNQSASAAWTSTLTYGFGYRCDNISGTDCASGFATTSLYKQFADASKSESGQSVMSGINVGKTIQTEITYKVNVSGAQPTGRYTNVITFIATPTF